MYVTIVQPDFSHRVRVWVVTHDAIRHVEREWLSLLGGVASCMTRPLSLANTVITVRESVRCFRCTLGCLTLGA